MKGNIVELDHAMYLVRYDPAVKEMASRLDYDPHRRFDSVAVTKKETDKQRALIQELSIGRERVYISIVRLLYRLYKIVPVDWTRADASFAISTLLKASPQQQSKKPGKPMTYEQYLQTPHWKNVVRPAALERADHKCQLCGARDVLLNVHHNCYDRLGHELPSDVIVLCEQCHTKFHEKDHAA